MCPDAQQVDLIIIFISISYAIDNLDIWYLVLLWHFTAIHFRYFPHGINKTTTLLQPRPQFLKFVKK